ncbi:cation diffusion facilitator family transporter [uncultured Treponema sp.]|uniref:cation diffusion facilitator family transporter n=1 Tax=uncultured Treponema sp. TaxID=162155 RepID=UPI0025EB40EF|nr:cation diffusion facilitator family transporter [uncultured Treponema sp.]
MKQNREKIIVRTSILGIIANIALASFKAFVGLLSHSIAIVLDAVNNLTDALSSVVTIIGTKLALKPADKKHPFGHGRAEYLSAMVIAVIILYAGTTALVESIKKIITPRTPDYQPVTLFIVATAVVVKIALGLFVKSTGKRVNSDSLIASGQDALMDSVISLSTLIAAAVFLFWGISLEAWLGIIIAFAIIKSGFETLRETLSKILGERINGDVSHAIKRTISSVDPEIRGAYDLVLNDYGPDRHLGSVHIEVPDTWTADKIDVVTRKITRLVYEKHGVMMAAVGVYSVNTKQNSAAEIRSKVAKIVHEHKDILQMHGFFVDETEKIMRFDIIVSFESPDMKTMFNHVVTDVREAFPDYDVQVQFDTDISD